MALTQLVRKSLGTASKGDAVTLQGSDPAAGAEWSETVPTGKVWKLLAVRAALVTSAVAGNRRVSIVIDDGTNIIFAARDESVQAASLTHTYYGTLAEARAVADTDHYVQIPDGLWLAAGYRVRSSTTLIDVGDNWGAPVFTIEEFDA